MRSLDKLNLKLILELESNCKQTISKISKKLKTSQQVISYRLLKLNQEKIVKKYITIFNLFKLDYQLYFINLKLTNLDLNLYNKFIKKLINIDLIVNIYESRNYYDLTLIVAIKNKTHLFNFIKDLKFNNQEIIEDYNVLEIIKINIYNRDYLLKKYRNAYSEIIIDKQEQEREQEQEINTNSSNNNKYLSKKLFQILKNNSRNGTIKTCNKINITPEQLLKNINYLEQNKIIKKYSIFLDTNRLNIKKYFFIFRFRRNLKESDLEYQFLIFLKNILNIISIYKIIGNIDYIVYIETINDNSEEIRRKFRSRFGRNIDLIEIIEINKIYKKECI